MRERTCDNCIYKATVFRMNTFTNKPRKIDTCSLDRPYELARSITRCKEYKPTFVQRVRATLNV